MPSFWSTVAPERDGPHDRGTGGVAGEDVQVPPQGREEIFLGESRGEESVRSRAHGLLLFLGAAADEDDRGVRETLVGLQDAADVDPAHALHLGIEEDEVRLLPTGCREGGGTGVGGQDLAVRAAGNRPGDVAEETAIVHEQDGAHGLSIIGPVGVFSE